MIRSEESLRFSENCIEFFDSSFILKNIRDKRILGIGVFQRMIGPSEKKWEGSVLFFFLL